MIKVALLLLSLLLPVLSTYCSSTCIEYVDACFDDTPQGCWVCANNVFNMHSNLTSSTPCTQAPQTTILAN